MIVNGVGMTRSVRVGVVVVVALLAVWASPSSPSGAATAAPVLASPTEGARLPSLSASLSWLNPPGVTQYHLQVLPANNDGPGINIIRDADASFVIPAPPAWYGLLPDMTYTWRLRVTGKAGAAPEDDPSWGPWAERRFRTPAVSGQVTWQEIPVTGTTVDSLTPTLRWSASEGGLFYFEVQVSKDFAFRTDPTTAVAPVYWNILHGGASTPPNSYGIPTRAPLEAGKTYYWRVRPRVQGDGRPAAWSSSWRFQTPLQTSAGGGALLLDSMDDAAVWGRAGKRSEDHVQGQAALQIDAPPAPPEKGEPHKIFLKRTFPALTERIGNFETLDIDVKIVGPNVRGLGVKVGGLARYPTAVWDIPITEARAGEWRHLRLNLRDPEMAWPDPVCPGQGFCIEWRLLTGEVATPASYVLIDNLVLTPAPATPSFQFSRPLAHPRVLITAERLTELKGKVTGSHEALWAEVRARADLTLGMAPTPPKGVGDWDKFRAVSWWALSYLVSGDERYLSKAREFMLAAAAYGDWPEGDESGDLASSDLIAVISMGYDWLYDHLDEGDRAVVRDAIKRAAIRKYAEATGGVWWRKAPLQNHNYYNASALALAGAALYDDAPEPVEWIAWANADFQRVFEALASDGATQEGVGYWSYGLEPMLRYLEVARDLFGRDLYDHAWLQNTARYRLHAMTPDYKGVPNLADSGLIEGFGPSYLLHRLAGEYRDGNAQWLATAVTKARGYRSAGWWQDLLWYDASVPEISPQGIPTARLFDNLGLVFGRSGWELGGRFYAFKSGPYQGYRAMDLYGRDVGAGHVHPDSNTFLLFSGDRFMVGDLGYTLSKLSKDENTLLVNGRGQLGEGGPWFNPGSRLNSSFARIDTFQTQGRFDYAAGQAAEVYPPELGLKSFRRQFLFIKPAIAVVLDEVETAQPASFAVRFHTEGQVSGGGERWQFAHGTETLDVVSGPGHAARRVEHRSLADKELSFPYSAQHARRETNVLIVESGEPKTKERFYHLFGMRKTAESMEITTSATATFDSVVSYNWESTHVWVDEQNVLHVTVTGSDGTQEASFK